MTVTDYLKKKLLQARVSVGALVDEAQRPLTPAERNSNPMNVVGASQTIEDYQKRQRKLLKDLGKSQGLDKIHKESDAMTKPKATAKSTKVTLKAQPKKKATKKKATKKKQAKERSF